MITIVAALKGEIKPFFDWYPVRQKITLGAASLYIHPGRHFLRCGIGAAKAQESLQRYLENNRPGLIINAGTAGSLRNDFAIGQICRISKIVDEESGRIFWPRSADNMAGARQATLLTATQAILDDQRRANLAETFPADLVDMEASIIACLADSYQIPFLCLKVVSDLADQQAEDDFKNNYSRNCESLAGFIHDEILQKMKLSD